MTVSELITKLQEYEQNAIVVTITVDKDNDWTYNSTDQKFRTAKNRFGETLIYIE